MIGIIGGSGLYDIDGMDVVEQHNIQTPYGATSDQITEARFKDKTVFFLPRHGKGHKLIPSNVPYKANIWALKSLGVQYILGVNACGSLQKDIEPTHFVVPNQLADFTKSRKTTFYDHDVIVHMNVAYPFDAYVSQVVAECAKQVQTTHSDRTYVTIEGPRFSTMAESKAYQQLGFDIIGMTASTEAILAREAEIAYACLAHVTDYDTWHTSGPVTAEVAIKSFGVNVPNIKQILPKFLSQIDATKTTESHTSLASSIVSPRKKDTVSKQGWDKLGILLAKYYE